MWGSALALQDTQNTQELHMFQLTSGHTVHARPHDCLREVLRKYNTLVDR